MPPNTVPTKFFAVSVKFDAAPEEFQLVDPMTLPESLFERVSAISKQFNGASLKAGYEPTFSFLLITAKDWSGVAQNQDSPPVLEVMTIKYGDQDPIEIGPLFVVDTINVFPETSVGAENDLVVLKVTYSGYYRASMYPRHFEDRNNKFVSVFPINPRYQPRNEAGVPNNAIINDQGWENAIQTYRRMANLTAGLSFLQAELPTKILHDVGVEMEIKEPVIRSLKNFGAIISHSEYFNDKTSTRYLPHGFIDPDNATLLSGNRDAIFFQRNSRSPQPLPGAISTNFRCSTNETNSPREGYDVFDQRLRFTRNLLGNPNDEFLNHRLDIHVYNIYDPEAEDAADQRTYLQEFSDEIFDLYQAGIENHQRLDAIYIGAIPFKHAPETYLLEYYHDLTDGYYKTLIKSINYHSLIYYQQTRIDFAPGLNNTVDVDLELVGGVDGTDTTAPTYTYRVIRSFDQVEIYANVDVTAGIHRCQRVPAGPMLPARNGVGYYNKDNIFVVKMFDETPRSGPCEEAP